MHHHTTLDIPIIKFEENIAGEKVSEKNSLCRLRKREQSEQSSFYPFPPMLPCCELCRNFLFDITSTSFSDMMGDIPNKS